MLMRTLRLSTVLLVAAVSFWKADRAWGIGFSLGQTKDELKLKYEIAVEDHKTGRVTVVFTLADEGRLKPLDEVQLVVPAQEKNKDGSRWMDLVVSIDMIKTDGGKRVGRVHLLKELAERAEIQLNTHTMDGKLDRLTRLHHVIPIAKLLKDAPAAATPPAAERKEDRRPPATAR
jgi:hypothetical protein